jgi:hypothetical protein
MIRISNGAVNEKNVDAVVKQGPNWEVVMTSGQRFVVSEKEATDLLGQLGLKPQDEPKKNP